LKEVGNKLIKLHIPPPQPVKRMTLLCKESMHLDSHMTTSTGLSCEAFENAMVCKMQPKCSEMRLRCGGRGCRRCAMKNAWEANVNRPHLSTSLRCTMYNAMWQLCTDAMATSAFSGEVCIHAHVLLPDALSLRSLSLLFPVSRSVRLPCSLPGLPSMEA